ncbi:alpha/beta-hydrolase [Hypoxylon cercidicola]|nr:alpha/beta-hydrolase [Hypoxylon cercidicola]
MFTWKLSAWLCVAACVSIASSGPIRHEKRQDAEPQIDLGYEIHVGTLNVRSSRFSRRCQSQHATDQDMHDGATGDYYAFNNIPYAVQPVGERRFEKPVAIRGTGITINNGTAFDIICPQAHPQWVIDTLAVQKGVDSETMARQLRNTPGQNEGCLYLDVYVPTEVFYQGSAAKVPVLVWIHGGGFTFGSKNMYGSPAGLIARSRQNGEPGIIVVSINYRLGLFGWLGGDVPGNLGLLDQRRAFIWLQQYIDQFGGDTARITLMGESAGAASIVHHLTTFEDNDFSIFHGAIVLSPAWQFNIDVVDGYIKTLDVASVVVDGNVTDKEDLRKLQTEHLKDINQAVVGAAPLGTFGYGPAPDGTYIGDIPQVGLYYGRIDPHLKLLISHTSNESIPFLPPPEDMVTDADVRAYVAASLPEATEEGLEELLTNDRLYPDAAHADPRRTYPWATPYERAARLASDVGFACTTRYLARARGNQTYNYVFAYPPGWHAGDLPYLFFNGDTSSPDNGLPVDAALAYELQDYVVSFARIGDPNGNFTTDVPFPVYGPEGKILELSENGFEEGTDYLKGDRCDWIQKALVNGLL